MIQAETDIYMYAKAIEAGVDIVDTALGSMAGLTSQPSASSLSYAMKGIEQRSYWRCRCI